MFLFVTANSRILYTAIRFSFEEYSLHACTCLTSSRRVLPQSLDHVLQSHNCPRVQVKFTDTCKFIQNYPYNWIHQNNPRTLQKYHWWQVTPFGFFQYRLANQIRSHSEVYFKSMTSSKMTWKFMKISFSQKESEWDLCKDDTSTSAKQGWQYCNCVRCSE